MSQPETVRQKIGYSLFGLALVACSMEMVPGWGILKLGWPDHVFYAIIAVCGAVTGVLAGQRYVLPAVLGFAVGGIGALFAISLVLHHTTSTYTVILAIVGLIGGLPGMGLFFLTKSFQDSLRPPEP